MSVPTRRTERPPLRHQTNTGPSPRVRADGWEPAVSGAASSPPLCYAYNDSAQGGGRQELRGAGQGHCITSPSEAAHVVSPPGPMLGASSALGDADLVNGFFARPLLANSSE